MTVTERVRYVKLPGRRRGIFRGSSAWLGPDHLLLVRSWRFREEYKRFHMGDIQSIAVADAPRFHISTRSIGIAFLWLIALGIASGRGGTLAQVVTWAAGVAMVIAWVYISAKCSCVCRIYTAVSSDDLPSVYRTWTARKFISRLEPHIAAAQGAMEGDWAGEVDARRIGPPEFVPDLPMGGVVASLQVAPGSGRSPMPFAEILVALMFTDAIFSFVTLNRMTMALTWLGYGIVAIELGVAIALTVRHARGRPWPGMQWLAIGSILITGAIWYGHPLINSIMTGVASAGNPGASIPPATATRSVDRIFEYADIGSHFLLGIAGIVMILLRRGKTRGFAAD